MAASGSARDYLKKHKPLRRFFVNYSVGVMGLSVEVEAYDKQDALNRIVDRMVSELSEGPVDIPVEGLKTCYVYFEPHSLTLADIEDEAEYYS